MKNLGYVIQLSDSMRFRKFYGLPNGCSPSPAKSVGFSYASKVEDAQIFPTLNAALQVIHDRGVYAADREALGGLPGNVTIKRVTRAGIVLEDL